MISCLGYTEWTDYGYEFDCEYSKAGEISCEDCICNSGKYDPRTGKKYKGILQGVKEMIAITDLQRDLLDSLYTDLRYSDPEKDNGIPFRARLEKFVKDYYPTLTNQSKEIKI